MPGRSREGILPRNRLVPIIVGSALFMDLMDSSALALALPTIARSFNVSTIDLRLALTAYVVTVAVLVPASSWMASRFGARRIFVCAMALFMAGSLCCAAAGNLNQLVISRILQGMGGAMMTPVGRSIMVALVDRPNLVRAMAWYTVPAIVAPLIGPSIAGLLLATASWRWIFLINLPVCLIGMAVVMGFVPRMEREARRAFDLPGFLLSGASILSFMALIETRGLAGHPVVLRLSGAMIAMLLGWFCIRHMRRSDNPLVDLNVLRHASLRYSLASTWLHRIAMGALMLVLPLQLQVGLGLSALVASQVPTFGAVGSLLSRICCATVLRRWTFRATMMFFSALTAGLTALPVLFGKTTPIAIMCAFMLVHALSRASFFMAGNALTYAEVEGKEIGHASVIFAIAQQLSLGLGVSLGGMLLEASGGPSAPHAFIGAYLPIALLTLAALLIVRKLPPDLADGLRGDPAK